MDVQRVWTIAYNQLELQLDRASFDTWLRDAIFLRMEDGMFVVGVRNTYVRDMLQHRLYRNIRRVVSDVYGETVELRFEVHKPDPIPEEEVQMPLFRLLAEQQSIYTSYDRAYYPETGNNTLHERVSRPERPSLPESDLNPRFVFERFIVNSSNRVTYEAARAIAENPARAYNPFMVYGGVGLGKTHLLQSIAHVCQQKGLNVIYMPSEAFTNDLIDAIRSKNTAMFRERYRSADVLLIDDVQFIAGKDSTQEEFFHTFNALYTYNKQIVLASDRHPRELKTLEDRLRSRFEGGLVTDVHPLEFESRLALLAMWADERGIALDYPVMEMIAERAPGNVRELEGVFNQIVAKTKLEDTRLSLEGARTTLRRFDQPRYHGKQMTVEKIIEAVAQHYKIEPEALVGKRRTARINEARQVAMYLSRELTTQSLPQIGDVFGGRSHTTVLHGYNKIAENLDIDPGLEQTIGQIQAILNG